MHHQTFKKKIIDFVRFLGKFDAKKYTGMDLAKAHAITYETLLTEEETQILGVTHVADIGGVNASFATLFSVTDFGYLIKWGEVSLFSNYLSNCNGSITFVTFQKQITSVNWLFIHEMYYKY